MAAKPPHVLLDLIDERLWRDGEAIPLAPKAFLLLRYLVDHPQRLLSKDKLLESVWPGCYVNEEQLKHHIYELRKALGDDAHHPRFIETVHGRGYRFMGAIAVRDVPSAAPPMEPGGALCRPPKLLGRAVELAELRRWWEAALTGACPLGFISGEPGIGKTALVTAFLEEAKSQAQCQVALGRGDEFYGTGEAFMPVLEALEQLCQGPGGERVSACLDQVAPTWLLALTGVVGSVDRADLQQRTQGASRERMLREFAHALKVLSVERSLILCLENLHWADQPTLDLLAYLAQRSVPARCLMIGTYRPVDLDEARNSLASLLPELQSHGRCYKLPLSLFSEATIAEYIALHFPGLPLELTRPLHRHTDGNPLFLVNVLEYLQTQVVIVQTEGRWTLQGDPRTLNPGIPPTLKQLIEQRLARLDTAKQALLEAASAAGASFTTETVAAALGASAETVETHCAALAQRAQFVRASAEERWPDNTATARYEFLHALYRDVLCLRLTTTRRRRLHQAIGERLERGYGGQTHALAAELAGHFERSGDAARAVRYLGQAADVALKRHAYREAIEHIYKALAVLKTLPDDRAHRQQELKLQTALGAPLIALKGHAALEVETAYTRARTLCQQTGAEAVCLFPILRGLCGVYFLRAEYARGRELAALGLDVARSAQDPALLVEAHRTLGAAWYWLGALLPAREHLEQSLALYDPLQHGALTLLYGFDPKLHALGYCANTLWLLGYPDQALHSLHEALALAHARAHPLSLAITLHFAAWLHQLRRERPAAHAHAQALAALAREQGFVHWSALGVIWTGWVQADRGQADEGLTQMRQGLAAYQVLQARLAVPYWLARQAEAYQRLGQPRAGLRLLSEALALADATEERWYAAELHRLRGELLLHQADSDAAAQAEACFQHALVVARHQQAKSWELRTAVSLARLWRDQGKVREAHELLAPVYNWFTEGFATADLQEAQRFLAA